MLIVSNLFKARLGSWMDQDVKYDFTTDLTGTRDKSVNVITETYIIVS